MKTLKMSESYFTKDNTKSIGSYYFEASMDNVNYFNAQVNIENPDLLTDEIKEDIKNKFNSFMEDIKEYGWGDIVSNK